MEFVYATKRQSRSLPMSLPRVHCANGEAGAWLAPGSVLEPSTSPGLTPRRSARISTTTPAPPPIAILPPLPPPPPTCDGSRFAPSLYFTCPVWGGRLPQRRVQAGAVCRPAASFVSSSRRLLPSASTTQVRASGSPGQSVVGSVLLNASSRPS